MNQAIQEEKACASAASIDAMLASQKENPIIIQHLLFETEDCLFVAVCR